jgi:hypothetical protein
LDEEEADALFLWDHCWAENQFTPELCPSVLSRILSREQCWSIKEYYGDCNLCASRGGTYCVPTDRCYNSEIVDYGEILNYCTDFFIQSYPFCNAEDPSNGCQLQKSKLIDDNWWESKTILSQTTSYDHFTTQLVVLEERFCSANFTNALTSEAPNSIYNRSETLLAIIFDDEGGDEF